MKSTRRGRLGRAAIASLVTAAAAIGAVSVLPATLAGGATRKATVSTQTIGNVGKVLVANGTALYVLNPSSVACGSACLKIWPAVTVSSNVKGATAGTGVQKSKLGVKKGPGGIRQVTYNGHALYRFAGDTKGKVNGNISDQWGKWTAVVVKPAQTSGTTQTSSSGSGSGTGTTNAGGGGVSF